VTDLYLPRGTSVDTSAPIRCFGQPRGASTFGEITGGSWSFRQSTGQYCPASTGPSQSGAPGTIGVGFRPLASGTLYWLFVPIKSTQALEGASHSPADEIHWFISASAAYVSPQAASVWVNVANAATPYIYFARDPSVVPYWDKNAADGQRNKAEWFANLYSAGLAGTFCWELHDGSSATDPAPLRCTDVAGWQGTVDSAHDSWQVFGNGPNGGYVPFAYSIANFTYTIRWTFTPTGGSPIHKDITFTTIAGPDGDSDGVPDASDSCPATKGTQADGCRPPVQTDPDGDGVFGTSDKCPDQNGGGTLDGCAEPSTPTPKDSDGDGVTDADDKCPTVAAATPDGCAAVVPLTASLGAIKGNKLKRAALVKGVSLGFACNLDSKATAALTLTRAVAKKLGISGKGKTVTIGSASAACLAGTPGKLKLKLKSAYAARVRKPRRAVAATITVVFKRDGSVAVKVTRAVSLT
jgi:hypothetical protein